MTTPQLRAEGHLFPQLGLATTAVLFHDLPSAPAPPTDPATWKRDLPEVVSHRLSGLALDCLRTHGLQMPTEIVEPLKNAVIRESIVTMTMEGLAAQTAQVFQSHGIPFVITKGPGIAAAYRDPSFRPFVDVDVLVTPDRFEDSLHALNTLGLRRSPLADPRPYFANLCREAVSVEDQIARSVDVHHHIPPWIWGSRLRLRELLASARHLAIANTDIPVPSEPHNLLIAALHVISDKNRPGQSLMVWRDVLELSRRCDESAVAMAATSARIDWLFRFILSQVPATWRPWHLVDALTESRPPLLDRMRLRFALPPGAGSWMLAPIFRLPIKNAAAYLAGYVFPTAAYLRKQQGSASYLRWWRAALKEASLRSEVASTTARRP